MGCQLQINCHFHFLNFPTVSSVLHIRKILVHWPFLEKSGPQKWVVGATLALKQNFLAGTLLPLGLLLRVGPNFITDGTFFTLGFSYYTCAFYKLPDSYM